MSAIDTLEPRRHLAASPIHLDVPHTSGVDWNPNGILRVIGTSKADQIESIGVKREDIGEVLEAFQDHELISEMGAPTVGQYAPRLMRVYAIGHLNSNTPDEVVYEQFGFLEGSTAQGFDDAINAFAGDEKRVAVLIRGRLQDQCVLVDQAVLSKIVIEGRRGSDQLASAIYPNQAFWDRDKLHVATLLMGGRGDDVMFGYTGDTLNGSSGNDRLMADECGAMFGGAGDDVLRCDVDGRIDIVDGGSGRDVAFIPLHSYGRWPTNVANVEQPRRLD